MRRRRHVDALILAKSVLGLMLALMNSDRLAEAHAIWISDQLADEATISTDEYSLTGFGVKLLEPG
jgi:hypothetical protein